MTRSERIQEDPKQKEGSFLKATDDVIIEKDQTPQKVEDPTDENPVERKEGEKDVLTPPQVSVPLP